MSFLHYVLAESNKEISVRLGVMWKNLSADTKESYYTASRQADEEHKRKYPGYYYSPKEARMNKMHKHNLALARKGNKPIDAMHLVKVGLFFIVEFWSVTGEENGLVSLFYNELLTL